VDGFIAASFVCIFMTFDLLSLLGFWSFLVLIFVFQAAVLAIVAGDTYGDGGVGGEDDREDRRGVQREGCGEGDQSFISIHVVLVCNLICF
jgi:hypothetical protein